MALSRTRIALAVVGVAAVLIAGRGIDDEPVPAPARVIASAPRAGPPAPTTVIAMKATADVPAAAPHGADEIERCGVGWVKARANADGSPDDASLPPSPAVLDARQRIVASLAADGDPFARAVADWLGRNQAWNDTLRAEFEARGSCAAGDCPVAEAVVTAQASLQDRLAREAVATHDPRLYALAFRNCTGSANAPWCSALSAARWAQIDEKNALPWLFMFEDARQRKDEAGQTEALFRMASTTDMVDRTFAASALIAGHAGEGDADTAAALALHLEAVGMLAAQSLPLQTVAQACRGQAIDDANRRQVCERIANNLVERSDHLLMRQVGIGMGRRLGWPDDRIDALRGETNALFQVAVEDSLAADRSSCAGMKRTSRRLARMGRIGEVPSLREEFAATGRSMASFVAAERQRRLQAAAAPAAPPPASAARLL